MLAIGTATQDVFLLGGKAFEPKCEGGLCYEHLLLGAKIPVEEVVFSTGGNAMNAAATFARQGLESDFMGIVGTDQAGMTVMKALDEEGIGARYVNHASKYITGYSTVLMAPNAERTILVYHGSTLRADGSELNLDAIAEADWLYISSLGSIGLLASVFTLAKKHNVKVAFNPSSLELRHGEKLRSLLEDVTILITNKEEMQQIVEGKTSEELVRHAANYVEYVAVTDGSNGAVATDSKKIVSAGLYDGVGAVCRLGAGDAFGSGFTAMLAQGKSLEEAVTFASANAHSVVQHVGAKIGILHKGTPLQEMKLKIAEL